MGHQDTSRVAVPGPADSLRAMKARQRQQAKADRARQREAAGTEPVDWRVRHAPGMIETPTGGGGGITKRVLLPIEALALEERVGAAPSEAKRPRRARDVVAMLESRGVIGLIHVRAAQALLDDAETAAGARQPRETARSGTGSDLCLMDIQMWCSGRLREAKAAIEATGPLAWPAVKAVVLDACALRVLAGSRRSRDIRPWVAALTDGLMAAARVYKMVR